MAGRPLIVGTSPFYSIFRLFWAIVGVWCLPLSPWAQTATEKISLPTGWEPLQGEPAPSSRRAKMLSDTVALPLMDDFSHHQGQWIWEDRKVSVSTHWALDPRSVGQAVFDGVDALGRPYHPTSLSSDTLCDVLTSPPIDLRNSSSVVLTFLLQQGGLGDPTEPQDSFVVDFWHPTMASWQRVWHRAGGEDPARWKWVSILVNAPYAGTNGFQFRLGNKGARSGAFDHWLVDHIVLEGGRTLADTLLTDPAWNSTQPSLIQPYSEAPYWVPFSLVQRTSWEMTYRRNGPVPPGGWSLNLGKFVLKKGTLTLADRLVVPVVSLLTHNVTLPLTIPVPPLTVPMSGPTTLHSTVWFDGENVGILSNDSLVKEYSFGYRYGWDDGTAERAYGVMNVAGAKTAVRTTFIQPDTLRGMALSFVPAGHDATQESFRLCVWEDNGGQPGALLYRSDSLYSPSYGYGPDALTYYVLDTVGLVVPTVVFLGVEQVGLNPLNIGYDVNTTQVLPLFYGEPGFWYPSLFSGTLRLRPFFRHLPIDLAMEESRPVQGENFTVFPNPAFDKFRLQRPSHATPEDWEKTEIRVLSVDGRVLFSARGLYEVSTLGWPVGLYTVQAMDASGKVISQRLSVCP